MSAVENKLLTDNFESYTSGTWPSLGGWEQFWNVASDPSNNKVTNSYNSEGSNSLQIYGAHSGCWGAMTRKSVTLPKQFIIETSMMASGDAFTSGSCHSWAGDLWMSLGDGLGGTGESVLLRYYKDSNFRAVGESLLSSYSQYNTMNWYNIKMKVDLDAGTVDYWINNNYAGQKFSQDLKDRITTNSYLAVGSGGGRGWIDDVKVTNATDITITLSNSGGGAWEYSRDLTILNPGAALTDYQVLVNLTGANFPIEANTSGADIRFTDVGSAELNYWIESWDFTNRSGKVWVNVTNIPAGVSTLRMWYGNPNATSSSNIKATFIDGDDFISDTSSNYQWADGSGSFYISNGVFYIEGGGATAHTLVPKVQNPPASYIMEMYAKEDAKHVLGVTGFMDSLSGPTQAYSYYMSIYSGDYFILSRADAGILPFVPISFSANTWYYFLGRFSPSNISGKWNRAIDGTSTTDSTRTSGYYGITIHLANAQIDWWFVRSYASSEPSISFASYNLTGRVFNASSGLTIIGALVKLDTYQQYNATTNSTGDYAMNVPAGTYTVSASAAEYSTNTTTVTINGDTVNDFALSILPPIRFINGTVIDSLNRIGITGAKVFANASITTTNASGFYSFAVPSGTYNITATFEPMFYTNSSITVSTIGKAVVWQDIELLKKQTGNITGSVTS